MAGAVAPLALNAHFGQRRQSGVDGERRRQQKDELDWDRVGSEVGKIGPAERSQIAKERPRDLSPRLGVRLEPLQLGQ